MDSDVRHALHLAKDELRSLRQRLLIAETIVNTFNACCNMVAARPPEGQGEAMGEDPLWLIDKLLREADMHDALKKEEYRLRGGVPPMYSQPGENVAAGAYGAGVRPPGYA